MEVLSLTNNEVKFLVTLDIDENKSKQKIDSFLAKTIKDQKIVFDVAVGKSEQNINAFLKKHKEKKASILFDVATGKSNKLISDYLTKRKQDTQSLIFYVNENATKAKINSSLATMKFNSALIELKADTKESVKNINRFIDNSKLHKKFIELDIDSNTAFTSINTKIFNKKLNNGRINLALEGGAFDSISSTIKEKLFTGARITGQLDVESTKAKITQQISKMKLPKIVVDVDAIVTESSKQKAKATTPTATPVAPSTTPSNIDNGKVEIGDQKAVFKIIKDEYKALGQTVELFNKSRAEGEEAFISRLKAQGKQVDVIRNAQTQEITKITTTYKNSANEIQKDVFVPITRGYKETATASNESIKHVRGFVQEITKLKNTEKFNLATEIDKLKKKLEEARHSANVTAREMDTFWKRTSNATSRNDVESITRDLEKHQAEMRKRNQLQKEQIQLVSQQAQLMANLTRIQRMYLKTVDKDEAQALKNRVEAIKNLPIFNAQGKDLYKLDMGSVREAREQISIVNNDIKSLNARATEASKASLGVVASLKTAMEKFPIWMLASTAFYGVIGTAREFGSIIIDIDKKMTDLKKVMSPDTDFGAIFDQATASAETFGKTISETMDAYNLFAKQGFKGNDLETLSNSALVGANVGDIEAGKMAEYMTASLLQWNKETSQSMGIVDSWNEISNNFATTVENLAQGQAKAGATARALGMDFDQLNAVVGTLNARTKQSGNEIGNFVKSTFSNILSAKGGTILSELGIELENADGSMRDIMEVYKEVAKVYVTLDQADKNRVTLGLAGKYHISRMQTLLDDLGSVDSMYDKMYETSQKSANSAMSENQVYMQSLEARINLARVEIEKLALAVGEAFMTEGMIQALQIFRVMAEAMSTLVKEVGFLPPVILATVTALALFSNRFSGIIGAFTNYIGGMNKAKKATEANNLANATLNRTARHTIVTTQQGTKQVNQNTKATNSNTEAMKKASKASKLFSLGFGAIGIASLGVGLIFEKLLGWIGKARREQEEFANTMAEQTATFEQSQEDIKSLADQYRRLSEQDLDPNTEKYAEYVEVQNELARLLPELKAGEDGLGNSVLKSTSFVEAKIKMLEKQIEAQKLLNAEQEKEEKNNNSEQARDVIKDSQKDIDKGLDSSGNLAYKLKFVDQNYSKHLDFTNDKGKKISLKEYLGIEDWGEDLDDVEHVMKTITTVQKLLNNKEEYKLSEGQVNTLTGVLDDLEQNYNKINKANNNIMASNSVLRLSYADNLKKVIDESKSFSDEVTENFEEVAFSALNLAENEDEFEAITEAFENMANGTGDTKDEIETTFLEFNTVTQEMKDSGITDVVELEKAFAEKFESIKQKILSLSGLDPESPEYAKLEKALDGVINKSYEYEVELRSVAKETGKTVDEVREHYKVYGDGTELLAQASGELSEYAQEIKNFGSLAEEMLGVTSKQLEETDELISLYNYLSTVTEKTAEETELFEKVQSNLKDLYPHLLENTEIRIDSIIREQEQNRILRDSYELLADGKYSSEQEMTYYSALGTKARIENLQLEIKAMEKMSGATYDKYEEIMAKYNSGGTLTESEQRYLMGASQSRGNYTGYAEYSEKLKELTDLTDGLNSSIGSLSNTNSRLTESSKASSGATDELNEVNEKYSSTLEKLETQLASVHAKQRKYPTYSKQYRQALQEEINLLNQQIDLNNQKAKDISGLPATSSSGGGSSYSGTLSGWNNTITSGYGAKESFRKSAHTGIDIDGYMGERLESNVSGKVDKTGYDNISGNYVAIIDEQGYRHFYAHLKDIAVATGQMVKMGDKIGSIGNTGNVVSTTGDGSHLHYEVKLNGKNIDPSSFVQNAKGTININVANGGTSSQATGNSNQDKIWNYFKGKGLGDNAVAGIMGNIQQESNFNPNAVNKSSGASGIFQWLGSRKTELMNYASKLGKSWTDLQVQLDFAWQELNSTEKKSLTSLQKGMSATDHAKEFERLFERSGGSQVGKRQTYAQNALSKYSGSGGTVTTSSGDIHDEAISIIEQLKRENIELAEQAQQKYYEIIKSTQEEYQRNYNAESNSQSRNEAIKQGEDKSSKKYEEAVNTQYESEKRKYGYLKAEYDYLQKRWEAGNLTQVQEDEILDRRKELYGLMLESQNAEKAYYSEVVDTYLSRFDDEMQKHADILDWENTKIQEVDKSSTRYAKTLEIMTNAQKSQLDIAKEEQAYVDKQLRSGKLSAEMYDHLQERAKELKKELITLQQELQKTNYEMIMTNMALSDESIDDIDFNISRSKAYEGLYDEGSADQKVEIQYQLDELLKKYKEVEERGKNLQLDMRGKVLGHQELQELEELIEDNALALLDVQAEILATEKKLKDFNDTINDQIEEKRKDVIDDILDTLKDAYQELADIEEKRIDDLIDAENERHDKAMENLEDELDQYNKIIDAKRRELDDEDRDRTHNNTLSELTSEKQELQGKLNLLSNVNTYDGKKQREELQKQIDEIDKQIVEERYQYEKDLRHQQLDDMLEDKTEYIEDLQEKETEHSESVLDKLDKEKEYYQKYYDDLLNDEREFERLRKDMLAGNFTEIEALFAQHAETLKQSLPDLEMSFQGMTERVGTQIRENVIYELQNLVKEIEKVEQEVADLNKLRDSVTGKYGSSVSDKPQNNLNDENGQLKEADLKVILAKFMNEQIAGKLDSKTDSVRIANIKARATALAEEGRAEGSQLSAGNHSLNDIMSSLSQDQVKQVGSYFSNNANESEFQTQEYIDYIKAYGQNAFGQGQHLTTGDKQILLGKFINRNLADKTNNAKLKEQLIKTGNQLGAEGRKSATVASNTVSFDNQLNKLTQPQRTELGEFMLKNSSVVTDGALRSYLEDYAERMKLAYTDEYTSMATGASLDTGGMTKAFGSSGGVDGKGGKMAILHEREIVLNPVDTARILNVSKIMENIMRNIGGVISTPTLPKISQASTASNTTETTNININVAKLNGTQSDIDNLAKQIQNRLLREKGKR